MSENLYLQHASQMIHTYLENTATIPTQDDLIKEENILRATLEF